MTGAPLMRPNVIVFFTDGVPAVTVYLDIAGLEDFYAKLARFASGRL